MDSNLLSRRMQQVQHLRLTSLGSALLQPLARLPSNRFIVPIDIVYHQRTPMSQVKARVDLDATVDDHYAQIRAKGQLYLAQTLKKNASPIIRQRLLTACLRYFESRSRSGSASQHSQSALASQSSLLSSPISTSSPHSSFQTLLASALDHDIATDVLIDACAKAADCQLSTVLVKCLFILANKGPIRDELGGEDQAKSQSQYDDAELFGLEGEDDDQENVDPQKGKSEGHKSQDQKEVCGKRKSVASQVCVGRTGQSFVDDFMSRLVASSLKKPSNQARFSDVFVSSVAREAPLSDPAAQNILRLLVRRMHRVDLFELPAFIYQLLLFASARGSSTAKSQVLLEIARVFALLEKTTRKMEELSQSLLEEDEDAIMSSKLVTVKELRQVQGTALLHIEYAVKQDPGLSAEIAKLTKAGVETPKHFLTPFGTGIILSLARTTSSQSDVLNLLREAIARFGKEMALRSENLYAARVTLNDEQVADPRKSLLFVAECTCENGWDYVKESLVSFALLLIDKPVVDSGDLSDKPGCLGEELLFKLFSGHSGVREGIMEQLTSRIALQERSTHQAIAVIRKLAENIPFYVLEHSQYVRNGIELVTSLPPWVATELIFAYKPLLLARQDLRDYFHLVIRKSLFHRDSSSRAVALSGFLTTASFCGAPGKTNNQLRRSNELPSQQKKIDFETMLEAIQPVRRVFSYPAAQRAYFYRNAALFLQNVGDDIAQNMASAVGDVLRSHLQEFIDPCEAPYVHLAHCVSESTGGFLVEPLGDLIWCSAVSEVTRDPSNYVNSDIFDLAKKLATVSIQDFSITKELFTIPDNTGQDAEGIVANGPEEATARANRNRTRVLGSVCEGLINTVLILPQDCLSWSTISEILVPLLVLKGKVFELLRDAGVSSVSDAFSDLGGDLQVERLRPGMRMLLQRNGKSSTSKNRKKLGSRKLKPSDSAIPSGPCVLGADHRFGCFSILSSAASKPSLPLNVTMRILGLMSDAMSQITNDARNAFHGQTDSHDFHELRMFLLAVAHKHVEDFIVTATKERSSVETGTIPSGTINAVTGLVRMAMSDFKRFRRSTTTSSGQGGIMALQIAERCAFCLTCPGILNEDAISSFCHALLLKPTSLESQGHWGTTHIFELAVEALENLVNALIDDELLKEAVLTLKIHGSLVRSVISALNGVEKMASFLDKRVLWATELLSEKQVADIGIVKTVVHLCLVYTENNNDLRRAGHLCQRLLEVIGDCDENAEIATGVDNADEKLVCAKSIQQDTSLAVVDVILDVLERAICDVEWCLSRMTSLESSVDNTPSEADTGHLKESQEEHVGVLQQQLVTKQAMRAEDAAQLRLEGVVRTLRGLARCAIAKWAQQERLLKVITKTYRILCVSAQAQTKRRGDPRTSFTSLVNECKGLAPTLWTYLAFAAGETAADRSSKGTSRASKEAKVMPQLIYEVERFEKVLITVQKKTKINILRGMRRNIARDFRIREDLLNNDQEENSDEDAVNNERADNNNEMGESGPTSAKRRKT